MAEVIDDALAMEHSPTCAAVKTGLMLLSTACDCMKRCFPSGRTLPDPATVTTQGPLMLEMGVLPDVAAATAATMIMFTAASASAVYIGFGTVRAGAIPASRGSSRYANGDAVCCGRVLIDRSCLSSALYPKCRT